MSGLPAILVILLVFVALLVVIAGLTVLYLVWNGEVGDDGEWM